MVIVGLVVALAVLLVADVWLALGVFNGLFRSESGDGLSWSELVGFAAFLLLTIALTAKLLQEAGQLVRKPRRL